MSAVADWRERAAFKRRDLERLLHAALRKAAGRLRLGEQPTDSDLNIIRATKVRIGLLSLVEKEAERIEIEEAGA